MNCEHVTHNIDAFVRGELGSAVASEIAAHCAACPACRAEEELARSIARNLRGLHAPAPAGLADRILRDRPASARPRTWLLPYGSAIAATLLVGMVWIALRDEPAMQQPFQDNRPIEIAPIRPLPEPSVVEPPAPKKEEAATAEPVAPPPAAGPAPSVASPPPPAQSAASAAGVAIPMEKRAVAPGRVVAPASSPMPRPAAPAAAAPAAEMLRSPTAVAPRSSTTSGGGAGAATPAAYDVSAFSSTRDEAKALREYAADSAVVMDYNKMEASAEMERARADSSDSAAYRKSRAAEETKPAEPAAAAEQQ